MNLRPRRHDDDGASTGPVSAERTTTDGLLGDFLPVGDCPPPTTLGPGVSFRALSPYGQAAPVAETAVTSNIDQPADVHLDLSPEVSLDNRSAAIKSAAEAVQLFLAEFTYTRIADEGRFFHDAFGHGWANTVNGLQRDLDPLIVRYVHSSDECHVSFLKSKARRKKPAEDELALALLVPSVAAQHAYYSLAADHLAIGATPFYGCSYFHFYEPDLGS